MMCRLGWIALGALILSLVGCSGDGLKRVPVRGKITANGTALNSASISFIPTAGTKGEGGFGRSDQDGNFVLTEARSAQKGIIAGDYKVRVSRLVGPDGTPLAPDAKPAETPGSRESLPREYTSPEDTPLIVTVPQSGGSIDLVISEVIVEAR